MCAPNIIGARSWRRPSTMLPMASIFKPSMAASGSDGGSKEPVSSTSGGLPRVANIEFRIK